MGKTIEDTISDLFGDIFDGYPGTFITEVGAAFVSGPGMIEGAVMGEELEGNHFQVMEDAHQDMKDVIVSFFSDALAEIGEGSFGGDVESNAGIAPIFTSSFLLPKHRQKGVHVGVVVNIPEQVQEKESHRVIRARRSLGRWDRGLLKPLLKFAKGVQWVRLPPGKGLPPAGSESCQCRESRSWKRRQCVLKLCESASKSEILLWPSSYDQRGQHLAAAMAWQARHGRGLMSRAKAQEGLPRNLGDPNCSTGRIWSMGDHRVEPETSRPALIPPFGSGAGETHKERGRWYRQTKATKCGGKAVGSLSTGIVPENLANPTRGEPEEGRAVSGLWGCCWETRRVH
jgi:hypothetical protein